MKAIANSHGQLSRYASSLYASKRWNSLTPELLFQALSETLLMKLKPFFSFLGFSQPNICHAVLANLAWDCHQPILTTNFDTLIERKEFDTVVHLHGNVMQPDELVFRINQVGKGMDTALRDAVLRASTERVMYIIGYSGADRDIMRVLREAEVRRFVWIVHPDPRFRGNVESLGDSLRKDCTFVPIDLHRLFKMLAKRWGIKSPSLTDEFERQRRDHLRKWAVSLSKSEAWAALGDAYQLTERYDKAKAVYLRGHRSADGKLGKPWFLNEVANAMYIAGRFVDCEHFGQRAIRSNSKTKDLGLLAGSLNLMGLAKLECETPDPKAALEYFRRAKSHAERVMTNSLPVRLTEDGMQRFLSRLYNNIGLAYANVGKFQLARSYYLRSLGIKRVRGDLVGIAKTAGNLCCLSYGKKQYKAAHYWKRKAFEIVDRYDLAFDRAYVFRRLGEMSCEQGRRKSGLKYLRTALGLYSSNPDLKFGMELTKKSISRYQ